ncbi:MAG: ASCH domain-containing protein [Gammaproteobacteria bacterium]
MQFTKKLRQRIQSGEITKSVRIWKSPRVKAGNAYQLKPGHIVVDSIQQIEMSDITGSLARETGFSGVAELLKIAKHGSGENVYLVSFHYVDS